MHLGLNQLTETHGVWETAASSEPGWAAHSWEAGVAGAGERLASLCQFPAVPAPPQGWL